MLQSYSFTQAGRQINASGTFIRYESASGAGANLSIRIRVDGNDIGEYLPGDDITLPVLFNLVEVQPVGAISSGLVRVGVGSVKTSRQTLTGAPADTLQLRTQLGAAWTLYGQNGGSSGINNTVQLWNPPGSGVSVYVRTVAAPNCSLWLRNTAMNDAGGGVRIVGNKNPAIAAPAAVTLRSGLEGAAYVGGAGSLALAGVSTGAEPVMVPPGWGLSAQIGINGFVNFNAEGWVE